MKNKDKVYAFIDSQNLHLGVLNSGWDLDYSKFLTYLKTKYDVSRAYLFIGFVPENTSLYRTLQEYGYVLIFKPVLKIKKGKLTTYKGNVNAELVLHAMIEFPNYQKAIIVSGDGDFLCLIDYLESQNKLLKVMIPNDKYSTLLRKFARFIIPINLLKEKLEKK
ncbi:MAG: NYN domain-containing protein [Anaerolineae bacterium]|nr:NYN domain-containing protein [Anaerolineae bacterium]